MALTPVGGRHIKRKSLARLRAIEACPVLAKALSTAVLNMPSGRRDGLLKVNGR